MPPAGKPRRRQTRNPRASLPHAGVIPASNRCIGRLDLWELNMMKNPAIFFDGTWNEPNDRTNAYELYKAAPETSTQETLYIEGVGTLRLRPVGRHRLAPGYPPISATALRLWLCQLEPSDHNLPVLASCRGILARSPHLRDHAGQGCAPVCAAAGSRTGRRGCRVLALA